MPTADTHVSSCLCLFAEFFSEQRGREISKARLAPLAVVKTFDLQFYERIAVVGKFDEFGSANLFLYLYDGTLQHKIAASALEKNAQFGGLREENGGIQVTVGFQTDSGWKERKADMAWNLRPGLAVSAAQMAVLISDIVWLVEQDVILADGSVQRVLVRRCCGWLGMAGAGSKRWRISLSNARSFPSTMCAYYSYLTARPRARQSGDVNGVNFAVAAARRHSSFAVEILVGTVNSIIL